MVLIFLQPDAGSGIVFFGLIFVLLREGLDIKVLYLVLLLAFLFILSLLFNPIGLCIAILIVILLVYRLIVRTYPKTNKKPFILVFAISSLFIFSVDFIFNSVFEQRHRDRFNIVLGLETDSKGIIQYNSI